MTKAEIQALVVAADPACGHYFSDHREGDSYTVWREIRLLYLAGEDAAAEEAWAFQIDRYAIAEHDTVAAALLAALKENQVSFEHHVDYEPDTGFIHHIFDCEG